MSSRITIDQHSPEPNAFQEFSEWIPWADRQEYPEPKWKMPIHQYPGVYLLAHFDHPPPPGPADFTARQIIYVGEGIHLGRRWYQFEQSARKGEPGHSGGHTYLTEYGDSEWSKLHVAALPIWFGQGNISLEPWTQNYRLAVERLIVWEITMLRGEKNGLLNRK